MTTKQGMVSALKTRFGGPFLEDVLRRYRSKMEGNGATMTSSSNGTYVCTERGNKVLQILNRRNIGMPLREQDRSTLEFLYKDSYQHATKNH